MRMVCEGSVWMGWFVCVGLVSLVSLVSLGNGSSPYCYWITVGWDMAFLTRVCGKCVVDG